MMILIILRFTNIFVIKLLEKVKINMSSPSYADHLFKYIYINEKYTPFLASKQINMGFSHTLSLLANLQFSYNFANLVSLNNILFVFNKH